MSNLSDNVSGEQKRIIVAMDYPDPSLALDFIDKLSPGLCRLKIGKELFTLAGPNFVCNVVNKGFDVFLDLKFHDIPNTVAAACKAAADLGVWMINVHATGGSRMMEAAKKALDDNNYNTKLIAVTVLTSMADDDLLEIGVDCGARQQVLKLAGLAEKSGLDGVVCSAHEAGPIKEKQGASFLTVTPGIRLPESEAGDQRRVMTPVNAVAAGADYLVIGRSITQSEDPNETLERIIFDLKQ
ncbi:MAG: orotidine-5'-phosphate decarboxylase [Gammaproteobacteria bacterium]|nr:MAG: orotidine-5'-phosphate decarboxylase [Gammaproteobacteria bacterium]